MKSGIEFDGIPPEGLQFLRDLAKNNNREWFSDNREVFKQQLQEPAVALAEALGRGLKKIAPGIQYGLNTNGSGSLFRIYRDTRFSNDKTPYKDHQDMIFWEGPGKKDYWSVFFLRIMPGASGLGAGNHGLAKTALEKYRQAVAGDQLGEELEAILTGLTTAGDFQIGTEHYKRVPVGFDPAHRRAALLRFNALHVFDGSLSDAELSLPDLVENCLARFEKVAPLHHWLVKVMGG